MKKIMYLAIYVLFLFVGYLCATDVSAGCSVSPEFQDAVPVCVNKHAFSCVEWINKNQGVAMVVLTGTLVLVTAIYACLPFCLVKLGYKNNEDQRK